MDTTNAAPLTPADRERLVEQHIGLVKHIAGKLAVLLPPHVELDDLIHDGVLGLIEAMERYDPARGIRLESYAGTRIRGSILDGLRARDWMSRGARRRARELERAEEELQHRLGRTPSREELCRYAGLSRKEVERRRTEASEGLLLSLDELKSFTDGLEESLANLLEDPDTDVEAESLRLRKREILRQGLEDLSEREQLVLNLYYFEDLNIREIGEVLGVSEARVSQLHTRSLRKLRKKLEVLKEDLLD